MMYQLLVLLVYAAFTIPRCQGTCEMKNWWQSFDKAGYSTCHLYSKYMNGLYRNGNSGGFDSISRIEEARCCPRPPPYYNQPTTCRPGDWSVSFNNNNRWNQCPPGFFLRGLYRTDSASALHNIEYGHCCKPANHPYGWGSCYTKDVALSFDKLGTSKCNDGYFMTGMYRGSCDQLHCIEKFKCCKMLDKPTVLESLSDVKTQIMDTTLVYIAQLAHYLGYGWCAGCRGNGVGSDFLRNGDSWEAYYGASLRPCNGHKASQRLKIHYGDFGFVIKDIKYDQATLQSLTPTVFDSGNITNNHGTATKTTITREVNSVRTVTHTTTSSWKYGHELGIELSYTPPDTGGAGAKASYTFSYEKSTTQEDSTSSQQSNSFTLASEKTLQPYSSAEWEIMLSESRSTVPYTATVMVKFSAELDGFLRWGGGHSGKMTNFHYLHRGSSSRPTVKYKFGDSTVPFYEALKQQSSMGLHPWMWNDMIGNWHPNAQDAINGLTNDGWYAFTLNGQFEDVIGKKAEIIWKSSTKKKRSFLLPKEEKKADPPRVFPEPPKVHLPEVVYKELPEISIDKDMS